MLTAITLGQRKVVRPMLTLILTYVQPLGNDIFVEEQTVSLKCPLMFERLQLLALL